MCGDWDVVGLRNHAVQCWHGISSSGEIQGCSCVRNSRCKFGYK